MIECGKSVDVKDVTGAFVVRFIGQCGGRFLTVTGNWGRQPRNGYLLMDWRAVLRELVALSVPRSLEYDKGMTAMSQTGGLYNDLRLTYPLSVKGMAALLGEEVDAVREVLSDLAVQAE